MPTPTGHVMLSPSSSHRWLICTPSAKLESYEPGSISKYAEEGTEAHALAELKLSYMLGKILPDEYDTKFEYFKLTSKYYDEVFNEFVNNYCQEVMTIVKEDYKGLNVKVYLEEYVKFEDIVPNGAGTSDVVIVGPDFIHIIDLKFGKGVAVSAISNTQLRLYALGAIRKFMREGIFTETKMTIIQPRLDNISTDFVSVKDLNDWALNYVKPRAALAIEGKGDLVPGDHCKFCKCKAKCQALANQQLAVAQSEFQDAVVDNHMLEPAQMSPEVIAKILDIGPAFIDWFKDVEKYALAASINGELKIPGFKLVEGRSVRTIISPESVIEKLKTAGFGPESYLKPQELLGITALEKNIGKKLFASLCEQYIVKPVGKPVLVPETDRRQALDAKSVRLTGDEFIEIETDEQ